MTSSKLQSLLQASLLCLMVSVGATAVPQLINYQGHLVDAGGQPLTGTYSMDFAIFGDSSSGTAIWSEAHPAVSVDSGSFWVILGSGSPIDDSVFSGANRWLEVVVEGEPIDPRCRLTSLPYAYHASGSDTAGYALASNAGWVSTGSGVVLDRTTDNVGIGTDTPAYKLHVVGSTSSPALNVEKTGSGRGVRVYTNSACALWVENSGNHGLRVQSANGNGVYIMSANNDGIHVGYAAGWAGYFTGDVNVTGNLSKGAGSFRIDHPLDPANKYLYHSFVESPDMMNVYNGNVILDAAGIATVELPDYFHALNQEFRYQLTCLGRFEPVYIAEKISEGRFTIAGGSEGTEVSWQVTGIRKDAYAEAHRIQVEVEKGIDERGKYIHPEAFGLSDDERIKYRDKEEMTD